jgi:carbonic anhydrase
MAALSTISALLLATIICNSEQGGSDESGSNDESNWKYYEHGETWNSHFPRCAHGRYSHQSPINIEPEHTQTDSSLTQFTFSSEWHKPVRDARLVNNNHTYVLMDLDGERTIRGGGLQGQYKLQQFHLHFGDQHFNLGSEHQINSVQYPGEVHFVFENNEDFNVGEMGHLAVLGFLLKVGEERVGGFLQETFRQLERVKTYNIMHELPLQPYTLNLKDIADLGDMQHYFRYTGSLTTPPCDSTIVWTVFSEPITITQDQYDTMIGGVDKVGETIENTFRFVMPVNDRTIYQSAGTAPTNFVQPTSSTNKETQIIREKIVETPVQKQIIVLTGLVGCLGGALLAITAMSIKRAIKQFWYEPELSRKISNHSNVDLSRKISQHSNMMNGTPRLGHNSMHNSVNKLHPDMYNDA